MPRYPATCRRWQRYARRPTDASTFWFFLPWSQATRRSANYRCRCSDLPLAAWRKALDVNLHGVFLANKAVLPLMIRQGEGDIINIGSALTRHGMRGRAHRGGVLGDKIRARSLHALSGVGGERARRTGQRHFSGNRRHAAHRSHGAGKRVSAARLRPSTSQQALIRLLEFPVDCLPRRPLYPADAWAAA